MLQAQEVPMTDAERQVVAEATAQIQKIMDMRAGMFTLIAQTKGFTNGSIDFDQKTGKLLFTPIPVVGNVSGATKVIPTKKEDKL